MLNNEISDSELSSEEAGDSMKSFDTSGRNRTFSSFTIKNPTTRRTTMPVSPGMSEEERALEAEFNNRLDRIIEERANVISDIVAKAIIGEESEATSQAPSGTPQSSAQS